ncbi:hypothetical protein D3C81_668580 [compost metagenome]
MGRHLPLAGRVEQSLGLQPRLQFLECAPQCAFAGFLHVVQHHLVLATGVVQGHLATYQHAHALARHELQVLRLHPEHRSAQLRTRVLQGEVQMAGRRARHAAQFGFHPDRREAAFQQVAGEGVELAGGEDVVVAWLHGYGVGQMEQGPQDRTSAQAVLAQRPLHVFADHG